MFLLFARFPPFLFPPPVPLPPTILPDSRPPVPLHNIRYSQVIIMNVERVYL